MSGPDAAAQAVAARAAGVVDPEAPAHLVEELLSAGIRTVFTFPSIGVDQALHAVSADSRLALVTASSESGAAAAAHGYSSATHEPSAVLVDAQWAGPHLPQWIEATTAVGLPVTYVVFGAEPHVETADEGVHGCGPQLWRGTGSGVERSTALSLRESKRSHPTVREMLRSHPRSVLLLPPPHHPARSHALTQVLELGVSAATTGADDPFPREYPHAWAGRIGFAPSDHLVTQLREEHDAVALLTLHDAQIPDWVTAPVIRCAAGPTPASQHPRLAKSPVRPATAPTPAPVERSPLATVVNHLHREWPHALFVADAGASHRVVAREVANAGGEALMTEGLTTMGWSLSAAVGAGIGQPGRSLVVVMGDGSAAVAGLDLSLLVRHRIPCLVVISGNGSLGDRPSGFGELPAIDWVAVAKAVGMDGQQLADATVDGDDLARVEAAWQQGMPHLWVVPTPTGHPRDARGPVGISQVDSR